MSTFVAGHRLSAHLHREIVAPMMRSHFPGLAYATGLVGTGSDVLGFDTERSTDHDWGPRLSIFLVPHEKAHFEMRILDVLDEVLPERVLGVSIDIPGSRDLPGGTEHFHHRAGHNRTHGIRIDTVPDLLQRTLAVTTIDDFGLSHWLTTPQQTLLELTAGPLFHDGTGELSRIREVLRWYPDDLWRYQLAARWKRVGQIEPFAGRCAEAGDEAGSHLISMQLANDLIHIALLQEKRYAPYAKWTGTAFRRLQVYEALAPFLDAMRLGSTWVERQRGYVSAVTLLANNLNELALCAWVDPAVQPFHERPYQVMFAERFANMLQDAMSNQALPRDIGGVDAFLTSTDALGNRELREILRRWFEESES